MYLIKNNQTIKWAQWWAKKYLTVDHAFLRQNISPFLAQPFPRPGMGRLFWSPAVWPAPRWVGGGWAGASAPGVGCWPAGASAGLASPEPAWRIWCIQRIRDVDPNPHGSVFMLPPGSGPDSGCKCWGNKLIKCKEIGKNCIFIFKMN